jgi:hypothetical protein
MTRADMPRRRALATTLAATVAATVALGIVAGSFAARGAEGAVAKRYPTGRHAASGEDATRTYFLASQGYYIEWIRRDWIRPTERSWDFRPSPRALDATFERWRETSADLEARFETSRIPVR